MHEELRHTSFFRHMDEFGYYTELVEPLPANFTSVFEIARVLEDEDSELFKRLEAALTVSAHRPPKKKKSREWRPDRTIPPSEEFDVDFIRHVSEVQHVLPAQYVLPEDVFLRRLARRELLTRVSRKPVILPFGNTESDYDPNHFKQKVYLLLDTSASMAAHHRFQMAKAVAYVFIKRNLKELGNVYFRTFDQSIGELIRATEMASLKRLIRHVMRLKELGNGTALEKAILTACHDIHDQSRLSGAEILVVTDGAAHMDKGRILEALGTSITLNTIKIGDASVALDEKILEDEATKGSSPESHALKQVLDRIRQLESSERNGSNYRSRAVDAELRSLKSQASRMNEHIVDSMRSEYGREIESISRVFVRIDDVSTDAIFQLSREQIERLRELVAKAEQDFRLGIDAETVKEVSLLFEHVSMLLEESTQTYSSELDDMQHRLGSMLDNYVNAMGGAGRNGASGIRRDDLRDIANMLQHRESRDGSMLRILMQALRRALSSLRLNGLKPKNGLNARRS